MYYLDCFGLTYFLVLYFLNIVLLILQILSLLCLLSYSVFLHFDILIPKLVISITISYYFLISAYTCLCIMFSVFRNFYRQQQNSTFASKEIVGREEKTFGSNQALQ